MPYDGRTPSAPSTGSAKRALTKAPKRKSSLGAKLLLLSAVDMAIFLSLLPKDKKRRRRTTDRPIPDLERYPTRRGREHAERYLAVAEDAANMPGLYTFGLAASHRESRWNNKAVNPDDGPGACRFYRRVKDEYFVNNPSPEAQWCFGSGGWFGQLPANAATSDAIFWNESPYMIFDPAKSTAAWTARLRRTVLRHWDELPPEHRNWLSLRRSMRSMLAFWDYDESNDAETGSAGVRKRLAEDLEAIGVDPDFMYEPVHLGPYPGTAAVYDRLRKLD